MDLGEDTQDVVGTIVLYRNKILLVRGVGGKWSFPKGRRRENETPYEGALREAKEEAGIDLTGISPDLTIHLRYGVYYLFNLWRQPDLEKPTTPEEILEVDAGDFYAGEARVYVATILDGGNFFDGSCMTTYTKTADGGVIV